MALETISTYVGHAKGFYAWVAKFKHTADAGELLSRPTLPRRLPRPIPDHSLQEALRLTDGQMLVMLLLMAFGGLRCGEVSRMQRHHIHDSTNPPLCYVEGKGGHQRVVRLPADLGPELRRIGIPLRGHVVRAADGGPLSPNRVSQLVNGYLHSIGIPDTAHSLRHWYGTNIYRITHDLRLVQEALGHRSPNSTAIYTVFDPQKADEMATGLNSMMNRMLNHDRPNLRAINGGESKP